MSSFNSSRKDNSGGPSPYIGREPPASDPAARITSDVSNDELQERASEIDPRIGELNARSFNARYPLQVKRKLAMEREETATAAASGSEQLRSTLRETLIDFAKDVAGAEDRGEAIDVLTNVDEYVDRVVERD